MATNNHYPVASLEDMARIPAEARGRFLAELPALLNMYASMIEVSELTGVAVMLDGPAIWIDDDAGTMDTTVAINGKPVVRSVVDISDIIEGA